jgi:hypothetical protein
LKGEEEEEHQEIRIATITGEDAKKILNALEDGCCIDFRVTQIPDNTTNSELVIELIQMDKKQIITV